MNTIPSHYYNTTTYSMLMEKITNDDKEYIKNNINNKETFIFKRWTTIINSLPANYYKQYYSQPDISARNNWFQKYLDYHTKDILQMPDVLHP
jgi:hypothetical protein